MPESLDHLNLSVRTPDGVAYGSVVTAAPPRRGIPKHARSVSGMAMTAIFTLMYQLSRREHRQYPYPRPTEAVVKEIEAELGFPLDGGTNDGVVPTLSQIYGDLILPVVADHLDVTGQFWTEGESRTSDWLPSGSEFDEARFERVWSSIADYVQKAMPEARE